MKESLPACGFSIGFERLVLLLKEKDAMRSSSTVFMPVFSESLRASVLTIAQELRSQGLEVDVYADEAKLKAQFKYASDLKRRWVVICGEDELRSGQLKIKDFDSGLEEEVSREKLATALRSKITSLCFRTDFVFY